MRSHRSEQWRYVMTHSKSTRGMRPFVLCIAAAAAAVACLAAAWAS
jgi:hypothetical protein